MASLVRKKDLLKGMGPPASKGDVVVVDVEGHLPRGDSVLTLRQFKFTLGSRRVIAGLDVGVQGMSAGGIREIRVPPHLAYGDKGTATIPPKAALRLVVTLKNLETQTTPR